ncbi:bifunctional diaminohydroxyphosphoribosylaminopyrimidine deaminase/5-amino-6-(5-phosphoribosylamino)uracil reductase RibD [Anatilimnocola floriformis]|uniref:bifunctional diaminohydroxyphosphoribosylaminopyrimidine deaminase/5-amino-6-(5-phosphoribosylamino)uracil reductase RibD n=1 Tax=Anatilimnocola floriformis TaxID=2948575 RepID=UPI0020C3E65F|nr:bifunctional diaminohydroxyphosphoribosylaminopyrimidine deaminase/5-amino-6-(5-phosphoribosylamino)uracil reductase RibD [Anatilimnocola floriformis]
MTTQPPDRRFMQQALELARRGQGFVEPNPMVGCVIVRGDEVVGDEVVGEGFHEAFGEPHAEVHALEDARGKTAGSTLYVTLEPCCHQGKTPPCSKAVIAAGVKRVVAAMRDPFPKVAGGGFAELKDAGIEVVHGVLQSEAEALNAPYLKLIRTGRPWVIAKWAMTLDGKIATSSGQSKWISGPESREIVQELRSRMDAIVVGRRTAELDDPLLTARSSSGAKPARIAARVIIDSGASLSLESQLVRTAREWPLIVAASTAADPQRVKNLTAAGAEVISLPGASSSERLTELLDELGRRRMTNILVEGGGQLLGSLFDAGQVDEAHCFIAPKFFGGSGATSPLAGQGIAEPERAWKFEHFTRRTVGDDIYVSGRLQKPR